MIQKGGKREGAGRKKGIATLEHEKARELLAIKLASEFGPIIDKAIEQAKNGDSDARKWLSDRAWGRAKETVDMSVELPFSLKALAEARDNLYTTNDVLCSLIKRILLVKLSSYTP